MNFSSYSRSLQSGIHMLTIPMYRVDHSIWPPEHLSAPCFSSVTLPLSSGHRTLYIGVHVPLGRRSHRRHRHHGHRHRKRSKERDSSTDDGRESPSHGRSPLQTTVTSKSLSFLFVHFHLNSSSLPCAAVDTPAQRVQFLLGTEDGDEEHIPHALFTELDEICLREGEDAEWRETARYSTWLHTARARSCS